MTPPFTRMLVTANTYTEEDCISDNGLVIKDQVGMLKDIQEVVSVGSGVRDYAPGDLVCIDFSKYIKRRFAKDETKSDMPDEYYNQVVDFEIPMFEIDGKTTLLIDSSNVFFKVDQFEEAFTEVTIPAKKVLVN